MEQMYGALETREDADATIAIADDEAVNEFETCAIVHKLDRLAPIGYSYGFNLQQLKFKNSTDSLLKIVKNSQF